MTLAESVLDRAATLEITIWDLRLKDDYKVCPLSQWVF